MADARTLSEIVADLQAQHGPAHYARIDTRLAHQIPKKVVVSHLVDAAPQQLNGETVTKIDTLDGVKYCMADRSWLLIRPSGTEPVLRIYAEARTLEAVKVLLEVGSDLGQQVIAS
jgi:phosphomannomutase